MHRLLALVLAPLLTTLSNPQAAFAQDQSYGPPMGIEAARELIDAALKMGTEQGLNLAIAIVDPSGELIAFLRMDVVPYATIRIAQHKARTAARFRLATARFEERVLREDRVVLLSSDEVIAIGGGVPIVIDDVIVGALGISGGTAAQDTAIAEAVVGAL